MDERIKAMNDYWDVLKRAKEIEPDLLHHSKATMESTTIWIHKGPDAVIKVEEENEISAYEQARKRLENRIRYGKETPTCTKSLENLIAQKS